MGGGGRGEEGRGGEGYEGEEKMVANVCGEYSRLQWHFSPRVIVISRLLWCRGFYPSSPNYLFRSMVEILGSEWLTCWGL